MNEKTCAVLVTFNRKELLIECIDGLLKQTRKPNTVYIVDNASTDGTPEFLKERNLIRELPPETFPENTWKHTCSSHDVTIRYLRMKKNTGGAGGFREGMKNAFEEGFEWLWLMDDDVEPMPDALERLLRYHHLSKCIHCNRVYKEGEEVLWEPMICPQSGKRIELNNLSFRHGKPYFSTNTACFEGMLIHKEIVEKIGYPDERFFIVYDDTVYGVLASQFTNILCVKDALLIKKINKDAEPPSPFFIYHSVRNYKLRQAYIEHVYGPSVQKKILPYVVFLAYLLRLPFYKGNKSAYFKALVRGFVDSFSFSSVPMVPTGEKERA